MILWALLYLLFGSSFALPTPSDIPINTSPSLFARSEDKFGTRSIWNIIWSCFSTIFACTWIAIHPNIPAMKDSQWAALRRRLLIMGFALIAPEMVILWAARQHFGAKYFSKKHQSRGWTMTHAFFIIMGGFTLHDERGTPLRILEPNELESLSEAGRIEWPSITEVEIQDRSKGDQLSKAIVLLQTSWFIAQCIVRGAYQLEVTKLEVATLAFAALTGVTYYLWWNKPLDVRCSIPVYLLKDDKKERVDSQNTSPVSPVDVPPIMPCDSNSNRVDSQSSPISEDTQIPQQTLVVMSNRERNSQEPSKLPSQHDSASTPEFQSTGRMHQFPAFVQRQCQKHGTVLGLTYVFFLYPLRQFMGAFSDTFSSDALEDSTPLRVPTFYSPTFTDYMPRMHSSIIIYVPMCVAVIFGGIHCVAWSFYFPTLREKSAWRISAASVAGFPILIFGFVLLIPVADRNFRTRGIIGTLLFLMILILIGLYAIARIVLLLLPCLALRELNSTALVEIQWTAFFPHIG